MERESLINDCLKPANAQFKTLEVCLYGVKEEFLFLFNYIFVMLFEKEFCFLLFIFVEYGKLRQNTITKIFEIYKCKCKYVN